MLLIPFWKLQLLNILGEQGSVGQAREGKTEPPGWLSWESAGLLSGRSPVQTPAGPTLRVFK